MSSADRFADLVRLSASTVEESERYADRLTAAIVTAPTGPADLTVLVADTTATATWLVVRGTYGLRAVTNAVLTDARLTGRIAWRWLGREAPGITGPDVDSTPTIAAVAVRHLKDARSVGKVLSLLHRTGDDWKRAFPGFVAATPFVGEQGLTLINYPEWTSRGSYDAWMATPQLRSGQHEVSTYEAAPPSYHVLEVHCTQLGSKR